MQSLISEFYQDGIASSVSSCITRARESRACIARVPNMHVRCERSIGLTQLINDQRQQGI